MQDHSAKVHLHEKLTVLTRIFGFGATLAHILLPCCSYKSFQVFPRRRYIWRGGSYILLNSNEHINLYSMPFIFQQASSLSMKWDMEGTYTTHRTYLWEKGARYTFSSNFLQGTNNGLRALLSPRIFNPKEPQIKPRSMLSSQGPLPQWGGFKILYKTLFALLLFGSTAADDICSLFGFETAIFISLNGFYMRKKRLPLPPSSFQIVFLLAQFPPVGAQTRGCLWNSQLFLMTIFKLLLFMNCLHTLWGLQ